MEFNKGVKNRFSDLRVLSARVEGVEVDRKSEDLESFKGEVLAEVREEYSLEELKDAPIFRIYRDFSGILG